MQAYERMLRTFTRMSCICVCICLRFACLSLSLSLTHTFSVFFVCLFAATSWRRDLAIPVLTKHRISHFNPQVDNWTPSLLTLENRYKETCPVLLFVIDGQTRAITSMLEVSQYCGQKRNLVVVIKDIPAGQKLNGQEVSMDELADLNRARSLLRKTVLKSNHAVLCDTVEEALKKIVDAFSSGTIFDDHADSEGQNCSIM